MTYPITDSMQESDIDLNACSCVYRECTPCMRVCMCMCLCGVFVFLLVHVYMQICIFCIYYTFNIAIVCVVSL